METSESVKQEVIKQVRAQYAMTNAKELIEVRMIQTTSFLVDALTDSPIENQRPLLREVRSQARILFIERREHLLHPVHGEVHVGMEPGQLDIHQQDTAKRLDATEQ